jgi:O-antigen ligase
VNLDLTTAVLLGGAALAALASVLGMVGAVQMTARHERNYFHWVFYAIIFISALMVIVSGRDLTSFFVEDELPDFSVARDPLIALLQPLVSLLILTVSGERIITRWLRRKSLPPPPGILLAAFALLWMGTVALPSLFSAHPLVSHDYAYPLVIGIAAVLATSIERDRAIQAVRDSMLVFIVAGLVFIPLQPTLVLDNVYGQGLIPGLPRFAGLSAHAVGMGLMSQLTLLCLQASPYQHVWFNRLAWIIGLSSLFLAQSKTAWITFVVCTICIMAFRSGPTFWRRISDPKNPAMGVVALLGMIAILITLGGVLALSDLGGQIEDFLATSQGAQIVSLTGRDKIWAIAYEEWQRNPVFGYGPTLWNNEFRASIGMPNATHAHNQFMDTLSRAGTVGAVSMVAYSVVLLGLSMRYAAQSGGLSLALFLAIAMRSVSEVPLSLFGYSIDLITQVLLLAVLAGCAVEVAIQKRLLAETRRFSTPVKNPVNPFPPRTVS